VEAFILKVLVTVSSALAVFGCAVIILAYLYWKEYRVLH